MLILKPHARAVGGFTVQRLLPAFPTKMIGPFIFFDHFGPIAFAPGEGADVRPHPHIGLATVTYLFEGDMLHRDSLGSVQTIEPGGLYAVDREVRVAGEALPPQHCAVLPKDATVRLETMTGGRVMLFGGASMDGDRHIWWNFVASSRALIDAASERWREQRFPLIPGETEFIPLPERH